ncbi:hypothetical protein HMN09_01013400 [Mycena chlorophos]|uniref:non-specific serine/threonine protein kinase n=1 Tax=Mycena chlorophos TaxID=658473 RepID=A0A8H6SFW4_MYCCL|nr:hypothetical protein HMN09_01013400 [Mycena chlorophos]
MARYAWAFSALEDTERDEDYGPGGFFPLKLGDTIKPPAINSSTHYRILAKLGHGSFSTVWLAHATGDSGEAEGAPGRAMVAIKTLRASETAANREVALLQRLRAQDGTVPLVVQLLEHFTAQSPNGIHQMLVMEPVVPLRKVIAHLRPHTKSIIRQMVEGIGFIHEHGVVHGGKYHNIGVALEGLDRFSEEEFWSLSGSPDTSPLVPLSRERNPASYPAYLTSPINMLEFVKDGMPGFLRNEPRIRIFDLGCGRFADEAPNAEPVMNLCYAAPELAIPALLNYNVNKSLCQNWRSDIWSLACTTFEIVLGEMLVSAPSDVALPIYVSAACGGAPPEWASWFLRAAEQLHEHTSETADAFWAEKVEVMKRKQTAKDFDAHRLAQMLRCMLKIDPEARLSTVQLLQAPFFGA